MTPKDDHFTYISRLDEHSSSCC